MHLLSLKRKNFRLRRAIKSSDSHIRIILKKSSHNYTRKLLRKCVKEIINFGFKIAFVGSKTRKFPPAARNKSHIKTACFVSRLAPRAGQHNYYIKFVLHNDESTLSCL